MYCAEADKVKVLCLGNNSTDTDGETSKLAKLNYSINNGLISSSDTSIQDGYYHTSVFDLSVGQIKELVTQFDEVVLLDQPSNTWNHPDAFYLTIKIIDDIQNLVNVTQLGTSTNIKLFEDIVDTNKSFCIFPFIEMLANNGSTTVCCRSSNPITKINNITSWQDDPNYVTIRNKMLAGELVSDHCSACYNYEARGIKSARQQETVEWANRLGLTSIEDLKHITTPVYYEVRPSNVCNLQCRSCGPENSNLIEKEYIQIGWRDPKATIEYTNFDFVKFDNLKKLYVAGGEPTAMIELYEFMQKCIDNQNTNFEFLINTNVNKISDRFLSLCSHFSNLQFIVSIDGYQKVNDYVRWLSSWENTIENTKKLSLNHKVSFNVVVSIYTISQLDQLLTFIDDNFPNVLVHCSFAEFENDILNPYIFPDGDLVLNRIRKIKKLNCYKNDKLLQSFIDGIVCYFETPQSIKLEKLKLFFEFNDRLDESRNIQLKDYIPELDQFRKLVL
jgi:hypothetical protein